MLTYFREQISNQVWEQTNYMSAIISPAVRYFRDKIYLFKKVGCEFHASECTQKVEN